MIPCEAEGMMTALINKRLIWFIQIVCFLVAFLYLFYGKNGEGAVNTLFIIGFWICATVFIEQVMFAISSLIMSYRFFLVSQMAVVAVLIVLNVKTVHGYTWVWILALPITAYILFSYLYGYICVKKMKADVQVMGGMEEELNNSVQSNRKVMETFLDGIDSYNDVVFRLQEFKDNHVEDKLFFTYFKNLKPYFLSERKFFVIRDNVKLDIPAYNADICGINKIVHAFREFELFNKKSKSYKNDVENYKAILDTDEQYSHDIGKTINEVQEVLVQYADDLDKKTGFYDLEDKMQREHFRKSVERCVVDINLFDRDVVKKTNKAMIKQLDKWDSLWEKATKIGSGL